ncbi:MAG: branched-chain amino acid transaminase [Chloroflexi bacterium]|nr:branched-chain amino acid transaminase [Chloroflexota bacterium]
MADNPRFVWVDGKLVPWNDATVHITQMGIATVSLIYEGIRGYWNEAEHKTYVFQLDAHTRRLMQSARLVRMKPALAASEVSRGVLDLLRANQIAGDIYIRPFAFTEGLTFSVAASDVPRIVVTNQAWATRLKSGKVSHACVSSWARITDNVMPPRIKASSNYLNSRYASEEAKRNGYDVALFLNPNGKVAEAPGACLMIVRDGKLITPTVTSGILESITRATLIQLCHDVLNIEVIERELDRTELYIADEAFLCGTGMEITPIASVDRFMLGDGGIGSITQRVESLYHDLVRGIDKRYDEWRTVV